MSDIVDGSGGSTRARSRAPAGRLVSAGSLLIGILLVGVAPVAAQAGRSQVREGNRLYEDGRFEEAHEKYLE
ncbi:MAG: hypothetical protein PVF19_16315, partial [Gemmatimonadota bacterium]